MNLKTINQLLDAIGDLKVTSMNKELGVKRQQLIDAKKQYGGLMPVLNTYEILMLIHSASLKQS